MSVAVEKENTELVVQWIISFGHRGIAFFISNGGYDENLIDAFDIELDIFK